VPAIDSKFGWVTTSVESLIDDEPVFIIRAKDKASIPALLSYAEHAHYAGASAEFVNDVIASVKRFESWQLKNGDIVKAPD
jgi:hypothetical protein